MATEYPTPQNPLPRNPCGWFAVGLCHELQAGDVRAVSAFGRNMVLFRTGTGKVSLLDAYCAHLGTNLGQGGKVEQECLRCPFHRWGFGTDGTCVDIPYASKLPPQARVRAYPVVERNGALLAWFHPLGAPPSFMIPEFSTSGWSKHTWVELILPVHIQEVAENGIDVAHFLPIHRSQRSGATVLDGKSIPFHFQLQTAYEGDGMGIPGENLNVTTDWSYYGMGMFLGVTKADDFGTEVRHLFHFTPIPGDRLHFRCAIGTNLQTIDESLLEMAMEKNAEVTIRNLQEDAPIWKHKRYLTRPVLCDGDGPYAQLRRWTNQFFLAQTEGKLSTASMVDLEEPDLEPRSYAIAAPTAASEKPGPTPAPPARAVSAEAVARIFFEKMQAEFTPAAVNGDFVVQYDIGGEEGGQYVVEVRDKQYRVSQGTHATPNLRVTIHASDWLRMHSGELGSARAYLTGKLKIAGDMKLARKLANVFPITTS